MTTTCVRWGLEIRKKKLEKILERRPEGIFVAPFEIGKLGPKLFGAACDMGWRGSSPSTGSAGTAHGCVTGTRSRTARTRR